MCEDSKLHDPRTSRASAEAPWPMASMYASQTPAHVTSVGHNAEIMVPTEPPITRLLHAIMTTVLATQSTRRERVGNARMTWIRYLTYSNVTNTSAKAKPRKLVLARNLSTHPIRTELGAPDISWASRNTCSSVRSPSRSPKNPKAGLNIPPNTPPIAAHISWIATEESSTRTRQSLDTPRDQDCYHKTQEHDKQINAMFAHQRHSNFAETRAGTWISQKRYRATYSSEDL